MAVLPQLHLFFWTLASLWTTSHVAVLAQSNTTTSNTTTSNTTTSNTTTSNSTSSATNSTNAANNATTTPGEEAADPSCYTSFFDIGAAMQAKDPFDFRTYIVCPNTVITIGTETEITSGVFTGGDSTLNLRQFSRVHCGEDGSSANNCTVRGGKNQVRVTQYSYNKEDKQRIEVKGFTFEGATEYNVFAAFADGDFLIEDCIFRRNVKGAIVFAAVAYQMPPQITFRRCIFDQNQMGDIPSLFTVQGIALAITDSVFSNNIFSSDTVVRSFYFFFWSVCYCIFATASDSGVSSSL
jgi:hypothetical protein